MRALSPHTATSGNRGSEDNLVLRTIPKLPATGSLILAVDLATGDGKMLDRVAYEAEAAALSRGGDCIRTNTVNPTAPGCRFLDQCGPASSRAPLSQVNGQEVTEIFEANVADTASLEGDESKDVAQQKPPSRKHVLRKF